jgi:hypothetical protein
VSPFAAVHNISHQGFVQISNKIGLHVIFL